MTTTEEALRKELEKRRTWIYRAAMAVADAELNARAELLGDAFDPERTSVIAAEYIRELLPEARKQLVDDLQKRVEMEHAAESFDSIVEILQGLAYGMLDNERLDVYEALIEVLEKRSPQK